MRATAEQHEAGRRAWLRMQNGESLHSCARREEINMATLDQWIWSWRAKQTRRPMYVRTT